MVQDWAIGSSIAAGLSIGVIAGLLTLSLLRIATDRDHFQWDLRVFHAAPAILEDGRNPYDRETSVEIPADLPVPYVAVPYIQDMELGYAAADLVLSRGGGMTLAEVTTVGLPAIYVPLPYGNGEQRRNALPVVQAGGGIMIDDAELTPEWIERTVVPLANDPARLHTMSQAAARFGRRDGDEALRAFVLDVASGRP